MTSTTTRMTSSSAKFARAFSLRDRKRPRSKLFDVFSDSNDHITSPPSHYGLLTLDEQAKKPSKEEEKKINDIRQQLLRLGSEEIPDSRIAYALRAKDINGDTTKAIELLLIFHDSINGVLRPFDPSMKLLGAENREKVTCYLDALLFAMFSRTTVFEAMIYHNFEDEARRKLVTILRLWVSLLRTGRLITTDITRKLQEALSECGWPEAARLRQQDASEAFGFITDKLELPLLTLKTDLFHQGKHDKDDHKFITERLLDVAIPEEAPSDAPLPLEKCLEEYFNNKVEVRRELQRRNTLSEAKGSDDKNKEHATHIETTELDDGAQTPRSIDQPVWNKPSRPLHMRERATSIFSDRRTEVIEGVEAGADKVATPEPPKAQRKISVRKEVAMPAWQFLNLIPWYADNASEAHTQVKAHFASKRPVLGICLKRYKMSNDGTFTRLGTQIDIPLEMAPPHFAVDGRNDADESANPRLKLVLQSVVCHRGAHATSGHYIALVRTASSDPNGSFSDMTAGHDRDSGQEMWLRHDDLAVNNRVTIVDINQALKDEYPYLLFYQVLPVDEDSFSDEPPPYQASVGSFSTIGEKLACLHTNGRPSLEVIDHDSQRLSIAVSDETRSQSGGVSHTTQMSSEIRPPSFVRQDSGGIIDATSVSQRTRPTTPHDDLNQTASPPPKQGKPRPSRASNEVGRKMGEFVSRLGGSSSREKINVQEVAVVEDSSEEADIGERAASKPHQELNKAISKERLHEQNNGTGKGKSKEKKSKYRTKSRRGSVPLAKLPERECSVM